MTNFPQDVYARNLLSHRGYPLWTPEPNIELPDIYRQEGFRIGDVGVVVPEEGSFDVFFNITLPREHPLHAADGVPNNFTQVKVRREDCRIVPNAESPGHVVSSPAVGCTVSCIDPFYLDGMARRLTDHQFSLHRNEGAMLVLPQGAERHRLAKELLLLDVIIQNAVDWYRFAREQLYRDISNDALYLITGFHKAQSWSLASFKNTGASSAHCKIMQLRKAGPMLADDSTWETVHPLEWRIGPRYSVAIPNQSVFIIGFKIAVNEELLHLKRVTVKVDRSKRTLATTLVGLGASLANLLLGSTFNASYSPEAGSQDKEANESTAGHDSPEHEHERVRVERVPQLSQPFHPSDVINRYMLKKEPSAKIAVTHDSQWIALLEKGILKQHDILQAGRLEAVISQQYDIITKDGAVYLQSIKEPKDTGTTTAAVFDRRRTDPPLSQQVSIANSRSFRRPTIHVALVGMTGVGKSTLVNVLKGAELAEVSNNVRLCTTEPTQYEVVERGTRYCIWDTRGLSEASEQPAISTRILKFTRIIPDADRETKKLLSGSNPRINLVLFCIDAKNVKIKAHWKIYNKIYSDFGERKLKMAVVVTQIRERDFRGSEWKRTCEVVAKGVVDEFPDAGLMEAVPKFNDLNDPRVKECKSRILRLISNAC